MKRFLAFSLLFSFFVVLSPRSWWHDHDHSLVQDCENIHDSTKKCHTGNTYYGEECFICDFSLSLFNVPIQFTFTKYNFAVAFQPLVRENVIQKKVYSNRYLRGPPSLI